mmetsp:Transcript_5069/g.6870  ORF Transcript_5069/g.6870 Transcript_5069/m.6870 type:complete len:537 (-) Transcript_5069:913-2523(-)|eukprot:CAMPEP_0116056590 /NCGR_PEP_ID=MMETSP0322-20121206/4110_1 /TAXON_ID=163516 /ORGANISM="Leptocylindrus danicus var. apora, Strain B651" /LENGTH=536 /DNA_ID=CAMNT_0003540447 /DNA_START=97 /DNA_END=1707 /DNA_ORIENTATION=-
MVMVDFLVFVFTLVYLPSKEVVAAASQQNFDVSLSNGTLPSTSVNNGERMLENAGWTPMNYPNPILNPDLCRVPPGDENKHIKLCDPDNVIQSESKLVALTVALNNFKMWNSVTCSQGGRGIHKRMKPVNLSYQPGSNMLRSNSAARHETSIELENKKDGSYNKTLTDYHHKSILEDSGEGIDMPIEIAVAIMKKMDVRTILNIARYYEFEDMNDAISEAAQYFATVLRQNWRVGVTYTESKIAIDKNYSTCGSAGVLIFISEDDRVCYVSASDTVQRVLTDWRIQDSINDAKPFLRRGEYVWSIQQMLGDFENYIIVGKPTLEEKWYDYSKRYGFISLLSISMFCFGLWTEASERYYKRQRFDDRSKMNEEETAQARFLQREFGTFSCPICLCPYQQPTSPTENGEPAIPTIGSDGKPLKLLRCGHSFDVSCWKNWIESGKGDLSTCPICRQDLRGHRSSNSLYSRSSENLLSALMERNSHQSYRSNRSSRSRRVRSDTRISDLLEGNNRHYRYGAIVSQNEYDDEVQPNNQSDI